MINDSYCNTRLKVMSFLIIYYSIDNIEYYKNNLKEEEADFDA